MATKLNNAANPTAHANGAQPAGTDTEANTVGGTILAAIRNAELAIGKLTAAKDDATKAIDTGKAATYSKLARLAYDSDWTDVAIKEQIAILRARGNAKGKNYFGEMAKVMQEDVRFHVPAFFTLAKAAFAADRDTMIKAHRRELFYVLNFLIPETIAAKTDAARVVPANATEAVALAKSRTVDVAARIKADAATVKRYSTALTALAGGFYESAELSAAIAALDKVTAAVLTTAQAKATVTAHQLHQQMETIETARAQRNTPTKLPVQEVLPPVATPLPGAIDIEALMAGMATMMDQKIAALVAAPRRRK